MSIVMTASSAWATRRRKRSSLCRNASWVRRPWPTCFLIAAASLTSIDAAARWSHGCRRGARCGFRRWLGGRASGGARRAGRVAGTGRGPVKEDVGIPARIHVGLGPSEVRLPEPADVLRDLGRLRGRPRHVDAHARELGDEPLGIQLGEGLRDRRGAPGHSLEVVWRIRSEEHTSELQSRLHLVCRLLLEKKKKNKKKQHAYIHKL